MAPGTASREAPTRTAPVSPEPGTGTGNGHEPDAHGRRIRTPDRPRRLDPADQDAGRRSELPTHIAAQPALLWRAFGFRLRPDGHEAADQGDDLVRERRGRRSSVSPSATADITEWHCAMALR